MSRAGMQAHAAGQGFPAAAIGNGQGRGEATAGGLDSVKVNDDQGRPHTLQLVDIDPMVALETVCPALERLAGGDYLDQVLDGAVASLAAGDEEGQDGGKEADNEEAIRVALQRMAARISTSGNVPLIQTLIGDCTRDGQILDSSGIRLVYKRNLGELRRTLEIQLERNFLDFFAGRVGPLRAWGARLMGLLSQKTGILGSVISRLGSGGLGLSGSSGPEG